MTPDDAFWGGDIWHKVVDDKKKTDDLFEKICSASLADDKKALYEKAKSFYGAFDFLDSCRLALAASS